MSNERTTTESRSLTRAVYHLHLSKEYLEDFKRSCKQGAKYDAGRWLDMITKGLNSIFASMTPESRELYKSELREGDSLFLPNISEMILKMNDEQRELIETMAEAILSGEQIVVEKINQ